jgi:HEAT repeat protein
MEPVQGKVDHIRTNLRRLYSERENDRANAVRRLEQLAQDSPDSRTVLVADLLHTVDDPRASFDTREAAMNILGDLRATEAVAALIRHLTDLHGLTGLSEHWYPAVHALHQIGSPAIPQLAKALFDHPDPRTRMYAAQALGSIGGKVAEEKLEQALPKEPIDYVRNMIKNQLWALRRATH